MIFSCCFSSLPGPGLPLERDQPICSVKCLQLCSVCCCSESDVSTTLLVHAQLSGLYRCWSVSRSTRGLMTPQIWCCFKVGNEMGVSLASPRNMPVLWPLVFTGVRHGFPFYYLFARSCLRQLFLFLQGIMHETRPIFTAQFYPDGNPGPRDTEVLHEGWSGLAFRWPRECRSMSATVTSRDVGDGPKSCFWKCQDPKRAQSCVGLCLLSLIRS